MFLLIKRASSHQLYLIDTIQLYINFRLAGCNGWIHPTCVGLGPKTEEELREMGKFTCPFCVTYLEASGEIDGFQGQDIT